MYRKVDQFDNNGNLIHTYKSVGECIDALGISSYTLHKAYSKEHLLNGYYYRIHDIPHKYIKAICDWCGKEFDCQRFRTEDGRKHLFCSCKCKGEYTKSKTELNCRCPICGKKFHKRLYEIKKNKNNYCSRECANKAKSILYKGEGNHQYGLKGNKNASWKSDEKISAYGYRLIRKFDHPFANSDDFVFEHRLVAEQHLLNDDNCVVIDGVKYLSPSYIVHHLDFNRLNNNYTNLVVMSLDEHTKMHVKIAHHQEELLKYCEKYGLDFNVITERMRNEILS